jgi:hypothetical protein
LKQKFVAVNMICIKVDFADDMNYDCLYATPPTGLSFGHHDFQRKVSLLMVVVQARAKSHHQLEMTRVD